MYKGPETFWILHIPSGLRIEKPWLDSDYCAALLDKLQAINEWNRLGVGVWQYWF